MGRPTGDQPLRVLHCPSVVGGHAPALARFEREVGLDSWCVAFENSYARYEVDETLAGSTGAFARELRRFGLVARALRRFDVIHFNYGSSLMPRPWPGSKGLARAVFRLYARTLQLRDLGWLKRAGKAVFVTYQGDDARPSDAVRERIEVIHGREFDLSYFQPELDELRSSAIAAFDRVAHRLYALNPDLLRVLPERAEFLPYGHVDLRRWQPVPPRASGPPVIVHAPTDRVRKGTQYLIDAVGRLRSGGIDVELELVEGRSRAEARHAYERADVLVDQLLIGWYGGLAVELMALGKPVVAYIHEPDLKFIPPEMRAELPVISATPDTIEAVLRHWLTIRRDELRERGARSRAFVERWHDPLQVAARLKRDYEAITGRP